MLAADYPFLDVLWTMFVFFLFIIWIWILITVFADIFRRKDVGGGSKALWIIFVIVLPYLGVLIYLIARPKMTAQDVRMMTQAQAAQQAAAGVSTADELKKLKELHTAGVIDDAEYESLKRKAIA